VPAERLVLRPPDAGHKILIAEGGLRVPDDPIVPLIEGDGIGPEVVRAARYAIDAAVRSTFGGRRRIVWYPVPAGERAMFQYGDMLPEATLGAIKEYVVALKGPLTTPVGGGFRSLNVALRKALDLYANVRPIYWIPGVPSPVSHPERLDIVIFREATEDVYTGIEWEEGSAEAGRMIEILEKEFHTRVRADSGIGLKPVSETGSKRLVRKAIRYAIENGRRSVTLVHKGNIMKYTEGAFRTWGYEVAKDEFGNSTIPWDDVVKSHDGKPPEGKVVIKDVIADNMFQQLLLRPEEYDVLATTNLNGDYLSDAAAAQIGGLGVAPGGNIGDAHALFEPIHGSAPKYAGMDKVNPTGEILAGVMMLEHLGWRDAGARLRGAVKAVVASKTLTYDLARQMPGAKEVRTSAFAQAVVEAVDGASPG
jgi:isocitrate dehydrogenase